MWFQVPFYSANNTEEYKKRVAGWYSGQDLYDIDLNIDVYCNTDLLNQNFYLQGEL
jgi:hypothetical protein